MRGQRGFEGGMHRPLPADEAGGGGGDAVARHRRRRRSLQPRIAIHPEIVVGAEIDQLPPRDHGPRAGPAFMRAEERALQAECIQRVAHQPPILEIRDAAEAARITRRLRVLAFAPAGQTLHQGKARRG